MAASERVKFSRVAGAWADLPDSEITWDELRTRLAPPFLAAFNDEHDDAMRSSGRQGVASFLLWLSTQPASSKEYRILDGFYSKPTQSWDGPEQDHALAFYTAFEGWLDWLLSRHGLQRPSVLKHNSLRNRARDAKFFFQKCVQLGLGGVPESWDARSHRLANQQKVNGSSWPSIAEAAGSTWPELAGFEGLDREVEALRLIRESCVDAIQPYFKLFDFGQKVLSDGDFYGRSREGTDLIRAALRYLREEYQRSGIFSPSQMFRGDTGLNPDWEKPLRSCELWRSETGVGLDDLPGNSRMRFVRAVRACLGPTDLLSRLVALVWICETGWNKQPTLEMPRNPFLYQSANEIFVATNNFAASFKTRRDAHVYAFLGEADVLNGGRLDTASDVWRETIKDYDPGNLQDGYAIIGSDSRDPWSTAAIISKYKQMSDTLLEELVPSDPAHSEAAKRLFCHITNYSPAGIHWTSSGVQLKNFEKRIEIWTRPEITFASLRKTYLSVKRHQTGSIVGTRPFAQHNGTGVLAPHYMNTLPIIAELDQNIRGFQSALEAIAVRNLDDEAVALKLNKSSESLRHALHLADEAGLAAVLGLHRAVDAQVGPVITFVPTDEGLQELFLLHLALRREQAKPLNGARFRRRLLPLLAIAKAIGREIAHRGLWPRYIRAARTASADLRAGRVTLVPLGA